MASKYEADYLRKINYLKSTKSQIRENIIEQGVEVPEDTTFRNYAGKILDIATTSGGNYVIGYYLNNVFYEDPEYTKVIVPSRKNLYLNISTNKLYSYDASLEKYLRISCESEKLYLGYYYNFNFYDDKEHSIESDKDKNKIYCDLDTGVFYKYDDPPEDIFKRVSIDSYSKAEADYRFAQKQHMHLADDIKEESYISKEEMEIILG